MAAPRFNQLIDLLKAEYDCMSSENQGCKDVRREWSRRIDEQATELGAMINSNSNILCL